MTRGGLTDFGVGGAALLILLACVLGAYARRIQGGWLSIRWVAFPLYAVACWLLFVDAPLDGAVAYIAVCVWFTKETNNGFTHWFKPVRTLYKYNETHLRITEDIKFLGVDAGGHSQVSELILGFCTFAVLGAISIIL